MIFGRTDLRISVSEAKFDAESDFEVRFAVAPPKSNKNCEKQKNMQNFRRPNFFGVQKNEMSGIV